jgi:hypothetical protein
MLRNQLARAQAGGPAGPAAGIQGQPPSMKKGGKVKKTGAYKLHKGEHVVPAKKAGAKKRDGRDMAMLKKARMPR